MVEINPSLKSFTLLLHALTFWTKFQVLRYK